MKQLFQRSEKTRTQVVRVSEYQAEEPEEELAPQEEMAEPEGATFDQFREMMEEARQEFVTQHRDHWFWITLMPFSFVFALAYLLQGDLLLAAILGSVFPILQCLHRTTNHLEASDALLKLAHLDKTHLGSLIEALDFPDPRLQRIATRALKQYLPTLTAEDAAYITEAQRVRLYNRLLGVNAFSDSELTVAILQALEHIGDKDALPYVERLADWSSFSRKEQRVRNAAMECLPILVERFVRGQDTAESAASQTGSTTKKQGEAAEVEEQLTILEAEKRTHQKPNMRMGFLIASWLVIVPYTGVQTFHNLMEGHWLDAGLWGCLTTLATQLHRLSLSRSQSDAARLLAQSNSIEAVGSLAEALEWPDKALKDEAARALIRLLPELKASDARLLDAEQRACLSRMLLKSNVKEYSVLMIRILKALEQVGDGGALPYVQALASMPARTPTEKRIKTEAAACLPFLEARASQETFSQELLRPAGLEGADSASEELLRPASAAPESDPRELLRAAPR